MINFRFKKSRKKRSVVQKNSTSYNEKFNTAKLNLELIQQEDNFSIPTRELLEGLR